MKSQSQFNWAFILIAGAIILAFFVNFGLKYKSLQDEKLSIELLINLDNSLSNLQSSPYATFDIINIPRELEVECNYLRIGNRDYGNEKLIFSPKKLKDNAYVYYAPFNFPFKIDSFYYLIPQNSKFYLIYSDEESRNFAESLNEKLPEKIRQNIILASSRQPNGKNIFINPATGTSIDDVKVIMDQQSKSISLYYKNKIYNDVNQELVYGAIFADDFDCVYNKTRTSMEKTIPVYQNKLILLQSSSCSYSPFVQYLNKLKELKYHDIKPVEALNQNLASLNCPTLY